MTIAQIEPKSFQDFVAKFVAFVKANGVTTEPAVTVDNGPRVQTSYNLDYPSDDGRIYRVDISTYDEVYDSAIEYQAKYLREFYNVPNPYVLLIPWRPFTPPKGYVIVNPPPPTTRVGKQLADGFFAINDNSGYGALVEEGGHVYKVVRWTAEAGENTGGPMALAWKLVA